MSRRKLLWREWLLQRGMTFADDVHSRRDKGLPKDVAEEVAKRGVSVQRLALVTRWFKK